MRIDDKTLENISIQSFAFLGDSIYEVFVRTYLTVNSTFKADRLHEMSVKMVNASYQADALKRIDPILTDDERKIVRHGRNCHTVHTPRGVSKAQYHAATALETLFGRLYLEGKIDRLREIFEKIIEGNDEYEKI